MESKPDYAQDMVGWYDPPQLLRTGALVLVSQQFALHADNREIQALAAPHAGFTDYTSKIPKGESLWIDFVADCGDGFNPTYAVASEVAKDQIPVKLPGGQDISLERGKILIFGGDLIYPTPTGQGYDDRLLRPYLDAFGQHKSRWPDVWALPGNHDWYDSLSAFRRLFCTAQEFGPWRTKQKLSYFAAKLTHGWWMFGVDVQLLHDIDQRQLDYFVDVLKRVPEDEKIILCCAEPFWLGHVPRAVGSSKYVRSLFRTLRDTMGGRLRIAIAGDLHHYQRLSTKDAQSHLITCGTGGAFLHPTHIVEDPPQDFSVQKSYPSTTVSRKLTRNNARFLFRNPWFGVAPALFYLLVAWTTGINIGEDFKRVSLPELGELGISQIWEAIYVGIHSAILSPIGVAIYVVIFTGFIVFTQSKSLKFRWIAGSLHSMCHVIAGFLIFWGAVYLCITVYPMAPKSIPQYLVATAIIVPAAWIVGSILMGLYLWISLNVFHEHTTEAFSSLRIQDWKGFLRMQIDPNGRLNVYFIGIKRVPRRWRKQAHGSTPVWIPDDRKATPARLEDHVTIGP